MFRRTICIVLFLATAGASFAAQEGLSDSDLASKGKRSTVLVEIGQGQNKAFGTAFCIDARGGYFITNSHVVTEGGNTSKIILNPGDATQKIINTKVVRNDTQLDLALLQSTEAVDLKACDLGTDDGLSEVQEVIAFGFPFGKELALNPADYPSISVNKGRITAFRKKEGKLHRIQIDAILNPGNSGGPILDRAGNVIGVVVSGVMGAGAVNFAIPVSHVRSFLQKPEVKVTPPALSAKNLHDEVQLQAVVSGFLKADYTAELSLTSAAGTRVIKPAQEGNGTFTFKFIPEVAKPETTVDLSLTFSSGAITGQMRDQEIKVAKRAVKLSEIQRISPRTLEVILVTGEKLNGPLEAIGVWTLAMGDVPLTVDASKAVSIEVKHKDSSSLTYALKIHYGADSIESNGTLLTGSSTSASMTGSGVGSGADTDPIAPLPMSGGTAEVKLPAPMDDVVVGGGGRYLIAYLEKLHKLAIFDANKGEVTKYLSVPDHILFAAGQTKLIVIVPDNNIIQRYSLETFERELSAQLPVTGNFDSIVMGYASEGPLLMAVGEQQQGMLHLELLDIQKMGARKVGIKPHTQFHSIVLMKKVRMRASGDGMTVGVWNTEVSPTGVQILTLNESDGNVQGYYLHETRNHVIPNEDGSRIFTHGCVYTPEAKQINGNLQATMAYLPALQSQYFFGFQASMYYDPTEKKNRHEVYFFGPADTKPLLTIPNLIQSVQVDHQNRSQLPLDKRYYFMFKSKLIVTIPEPNDRFVLTHFDLAEKLKSADVDYLFVSSTPPKAAQKNSIFTYKIAVESRQGAIKFALDSGPKGMTLSPDGELAWTPPDDADAETGVIVRINDKSGQEIFHTFSVKVRAAQ